MKVLSIFAHPHDETMLVGGILALLFPQGDQVHYISATRVKVESMENRRFVRLKNWVRFVKELVGRLEAQAGRLRETGLVKES